MWQCLNVSVSLWSVCVYVSTSLCRRIDVVDVYVGVGGVSIGGRWAKVALFL